MCWSLVVNILLVNTKCAWTINDRRVSMEWFLSFGSFKLNMIAPKNKRIVMVEKRIVKLIPYND